MGFGSEHLRAKALTALEEIVQECRYREPSRGFAVRFVLAYLWSLKPSARGPFDDFWKALDKRDIWRMQSADQALNGIYRHLGIDRPDELAFKFWKELHAQHRSRTAASGGPPDQDSAQSP